MRKWVISLVCILSFALFSPLPVFAHFPATDGKITVTLHVDPDDDPVPTQQANLYFLITDLTNKFTLSKCACVVTVSEQGNQLFQGPLSLNKSASPSIWGEHVPFIFPKKDVYQISLKGIPTTKNAFQPFTLLWNFRVDQDPPTPLFENPLVLFSTFIVIGIVIFVCVRFS